MHDSSYERAFRLLTSQRAKDAFDLRSKETAPAIAMAATRLAKLPDGATLDRRGRPLCDGQPLRYGVRPELLGHACRRGGLNNTYLDYERHLCPQFDWAFTALLDDLEQRGLLQETVIAVLSEFGRTPRLNARGGRDIIRRPGPTSCAAANIRGGQVIGSTDRIGSPPMTIRSNRRKCSRRSIMAWALTSTPPRCRPGERPVRLVDAEPIRQLFA